MRPSIPAAQNSGPSLVGAIRPLAVMPATLEAELVELLARALVQDLRARPVRLAKPTTVQGNPEATVGPPGGIDRSREAPRTLAQRHRVRTGVERGKGGAEAGPEGR